MPRPHRSEAEYRVSGPELPGADDEPDLFEDQRLPESPAHRTQAPAGKTPAERRAGRLRIVLALLAIVLLLVAVLTVYLYRSAQAWEDRAGSYLDTSRELGDNLAGTRAELTGVTSELEAVRGQLSTATQRITELADEKAQLRDESEIQQQLVDYQERISDAAGQVALALDQCVQGQNNLIGFLRNADDYDPVELEEYGETVQALCDQATEANIALQRELAR